MRREQSSSTHVWVRGGGGASALGRGVGTRDTASREGEQLQSGAAESQRQAIPAFPILVTAAMGEIAALTTVIPYKTREM